jgi:tripartite-type tricarboxylate transporter receptor subunit TctC
MKKMRKRTLVIVGILSFLILLPQSIKLAAAKDPDYPTKPITFYIHFGAGGVTDLSERAFIEAAAKHLGQPFTPINKPGGGGTIAAIAVMNAKPDGYTLGSISASNGLVAPFSKDSPYRDLSKTTLIANFGNYIFPLLVRNDAPWKTWKEFIEWARKNPRAAKLSITGGTGVTNQGLVLPQIERKEGVEFQYIPFKSSAEAFSAAIGGHVTMFAGAFDVTSAPFVDEGKMRILLYWGTQKAKGYEHIPSVKELYGILNPDLLGVFGPKNLPEYVLKRLDDAFAKAAKDPNFISVMERMYCPVVYMDRIQMERYVGEMLSEVGRVLKMLQAEEAEKKK